MCSNGGGREKERRAAAEEGGRRDEERRSVEGGWRKGSGGIGVAVGATRTRRAERSNRVRRVRPQRYQASMISCGGLARGRRAFREKEGGRERKVGRRGSRGSTLDRAALVDSRKRKNARRASRGEEATGWPSLVWEREVCVCEVVLVPVPPRSRRNSTLIAAIQRVTTRPTKLANTLERRHGVGEEDGGGYA